MLSTTVALHEESNIQPQIFSNMQYYYPEKTDQQNFSRVVPNLDVKRSNQNVKNML
jgi:hypothetical protein